MVSCREEVEKAQSTVRMLQREVSEKDRTIIQLEKRIPGEKMRLQLIQITKQYYEVWWLFLVVSAAGDALQRRYLLTVFA